MQKKSLEKFSYRGEPERKEPQENSCGQD